MHNTKNIVLVEVVWSDDIISQQYIKRLNEYLNPYNKPDITTAMWNKEILPGIDKRNVYSRFMIVFDYDNLKDYQKCFSYSSPKFDDNKADLRYYILPNRQKVMLNSSIDIPSQYLIKVDFGVMIANETNEEIKKNLMDNVKNLSFVKQHKKNILEQYDVILRNVKDNPKFHPNNIQWAHDRMINDKKQHEFCLKEIDWLKTTKISFK